MAAKGPAIDMHVLWESLIITTSPEHIQLILATDFNNYVKGQLSIPTSFHAHLTRLMYPQEVDFKALWGQSWVLEYSTQTVKCGSQSLKTLMSS